MNFIITNTFTDSLARLNKEQKGDKPTAVDLYINPSNPGLKFHKLDRASRSQGVLACIPDIHNAGQVIL
ncbi:MAG: hypothetical protein ABIN18_05010 [Pseudomonadota bacterium]